MKLSTAIKLGAMLKPQAFGLTRGPVDYPPVLGDILHLRAVEGTCALGAAADAGYTQFAHTIDAFCPACGYMSGLAWTALHLNDEHRWTREAIADWVATVEPQEIEVTVTFTPCTCTVITGGTVVRSANCQVHHTVTA